MAWENGQMSADDFDEEEIAEIAEDLEDGEGVHLVPHGDIAAHAQATNCICQPRLIFRDAERAVEIWLHTFLRSVVN